MKKIISTLLALAGVSALAYAVGLSGLIINQPGLAYNQRFTFDLQNADVNTISATAVYSSAAFSAAAFGTGQVSTGSLTVASNTLLTAAAATDNLTVVSTAGNRGDSIVIPNRVGPGAHIFLAGRDWTYGATTALTAQSIAASLSTIQWLSVSVVGNVIFTTAPVGAFYNSISFTSNNPSNLSIASSHFAGGNDNATVYVNGFGVQAFRNFTPGGSASASATAIATAINTLPTLSGQVTATPSGASVTLQSKAAGAIWNFPLATANVSAITVASPNMIGGLTPAWTLNGKTIAAPAHGYTLALPLLYTAGASPAIGGLSSGTTYYAVPLDANTLELATSQGNAIAATPIVVTFTSTSTLTTALNYSLTPLPFVVGSTGFDWEVSNDNSHWSTLPISSVTYTVPGSSSWDFGRINQRYLSLNVVAPTSGALSLQVTAQSIYTY